MGAVLAFIFGFVLQVWMVRRQERFQKKLLERQLSFMEKLERDRAANDEKLEKNRADILKSIAEANRRQESFERFIDRTSKPSR